MEKKSLSAIKNKTLARFFYRRFSSCLFLLLLSPFATTIVLSEGLGKNLAFATNQGDDSVSVISLVDFQVIKNIKVGRAPAGIAIDNINGQVFVSNAEDKSISVIKINELKTIKTIKITGSAVGVEISHNGDYIYVADWFNNSLLVYSNLKFKLLKSFFIFVSNFSPKICPEIKFLL